MVTSRFHTIPVVGIEIMEPIGVMVGQLPSQYLLEEELEVPLSHLPVYIFYDCG
tara:strand:+ start:536 stop:697 length:162 start_codon:yes stop_codon:yes gene_type:complete